MLARIRKEHSDEERLQAQILLDNAVKEHFQALTGRWKSEMNTLLVYVGSAS